MRTGTAIIALFLLVAASLSSSAQDNAPSGTGTGAGTLEPTDRRPAEGPFEPAPLASPEASPFGTDRTTPSDVRPDEIESRPIGEPDDRRGTGGLGTETGPGGTETRPGGTGTGTSPAGTGTGSGGTGPTGTGTGGGR